MSIRFSCYFQTPPALLEQEGLLNPFIDRDSRFFIHSKLLKNTSHPALRGSYRKVRKHFQRFAYLVTSAGVLRRKDAAFRELEKLFHFPEPAGLCIGYSKSRKVGFGLRGHYAARILDTFHRISRSVDLPPEVFEFLPVLEEGIGFDQLSDMVANLIEPDLAQLTEDAVKKFGIRKTREVRIGNRNYRLPWYQESGSHILLLPRDILCKVPHVTSFDEVEEIVSYHDALKDEYNEIWVQTMSEGVRLRKSAVKAQIRKILISRPDILGDLVKSYRAAKRLPYDFSRDPDNEFRWADMIKELFSTKPLKKVSGLSLTEAVSCLLGQFREFCGSDRLCENFFSERKRLKEKMVEEIFLEMARLCIDRLRPSVSLEYRPEPSHADFTFKRGGEKVLLEFRLLRNTSWRKGLVKQMVAYCNEEKTRKAYCLVIHCGESKDKVKLINLRTDLDKLPKSYEIQLVSIFAGQGQPGLVNSA